MDLVFCESSIIKAWVERQTASITKRKLQAEIRDHVNRICRHLDTLRSSGAAGKLACTLTAAAYCVTEFYKARDLPFSGGNRDFVQRKAYAREAARVLNETVELLSATSEHFKEAERLWYAFCTRGEKSAYARFEDYVDAAVLLMASRGTRIIHVVVGHSHLPYILEKCRFAGHVHLL